MNYDETAAHPLARSRGKNVNWRVKERVTIVRSNEPLLVYSAIETMENIGNTEVLCVILSCLMLA